GVPSGQRLEPRRRSVGYGEGRPRHPQEGSRPRWLGRRRADQEWQDQERPEPRGDGETAQDRRRPAEALLTGGGWVSEEGAGIQLAHGPPRPRPYQAQLAGDARLVGDRQLVEARRQI